MREAICKPKSMVKTLNKQTIPHNDIETSGWLLLIMAHITHMQPGVEKRREWYRRFVENKPASSLKHVLTILSHLIPQCLPGENWFIQLSGWVARTCEELEIHFTAVQLGMFSEKMSAYDAICSTSSASLSRNTPFPQFELTMGEATPR